jgi:replicative DNA helicase
MMADGHTGNDIAKYLGVSRATLYRCLSGGGCVVRCPVDPETIRAAERIGNYFKATAINVFTGMADPNIADAVYLLDRVASLDSDEMSQRELFNACSRPRFPTMAAMLPALNRLVEHGWLISLEASKSTKAGRPASPRYMVHPAAKYAEYAKG